MGSMFALALMVGTSASFDEAFLKSPKTSRFLNQVTMKEQNKTGGFDSTDTTIKSSSASDNSQKTLTIKKSKKTNKK